MTLRDFLALLVPLGLAVAGFYRWRSNGYWMPRIVHWCAAIALGIGALLVWMSYDSGAPNATRMWSILLVLPALVYWAFLVYGGGSGVRNLNRFLSMHASMDQTDVLHVLNQHFGPYRKKAYESLLPLATAPEIIKIASPSGRNYEMCVAAVRVIDANAPPQLEVLASLAEVRSSGGSPLAHAIFRKATSGRILDDAFATPMRGKFWR